LTQASKPSAEARSDCWLQAFNLAQLEALCVIACKLEDGWGRILTDWQQEVGLPGQSAGSGANGDLSGSPLYFFAWKELGSQQLWLKLSC